MHLPMHKCLRVYYVPETILGTKNSAVEKKNSLRLVAYILMSSEMGILI